MFLHFVRNAINVFIQIVELPFVKFVFGNEISKLSFVNVISDFFSGVLEDPIRVRTIYYFNNVVKG